MATIVAQHILAAVPVQRSSSQIASSKSDASRYAAISFGKSEVNGHALTAKASLSSVKAVSRKQLAIVAADNGVPAASTLDPKLQDDMKRAVAKRAAELVQPGMVVGLGTGSTACMAIEELGKRITAGKLKDVVGIATSYQARVLARQFGVKTVDLNDVNHVDIAIDGADEVDANMNLIKGGGAAHTMEKVVDTIAKNTVIIVDQSKVVSKLGLSTPVAVEVLPYAISPVVRALVAIGGSPEIRSALKKDGPVITDLGNMIVDVSFPGIEDAAALEQQINMIPGVIENGLFVGITQTVLVSGVDGGEVTVVELADFVKTLPAQVAA
eukprot:jgi/Mesen1/3439/ME000194S02587